MPLQKLRLPFDDPDWLFELEYGGFRAPSSFEGRRYWLVTRNGNAFKSFPDLCEFFWPAVAEGHWILVRV